MNERTRGRIVAVALAGIVLCAFGLRAASPSPTLVSGDDAIVPVFVVDAWPQEGTGLSCLTLTSHRAAGNPLRLLVFLYGWVQPLSCFLSAAAWTALGWPITEATWSAPQILAGSLTPLLAWLLVRRLASPGWGLLAALAVAVAPIHVLQSRGLCPGVVWAFFLQLSVLLVLLRYLERPVWQRGLALGGLLVLYMNSHPEWIAMLPLVLAASVLAVPGGGTWRERLRRALGLLGRPVVWALPAAGLLAWVGTGVAIGGPLKHLLHKGGRGAPGLYLGFWSWVLVQNLGAPLAAMAALAGPGALWRLRDARLLPLAWAAIYSLPFILWVGPQATITETYIPHGQQALLLCVPVLLASLPDRRLRRAAAGLFLAGCAWAAGSAAVTAWDLDGPELLRKHGYTYRRHMPDPGYKAAAWWVRTRLPEDARVHSFAFGGAGMETLMTVYYLDRVVGGLTDVMLPEASAALREELDATDCILVQEQDTAALEAALKDVLPRPWPVAAEVRRQGTPVFRILVKDWDGPPEQVDTGAANHAFDKDFGSMRTLGGPDKADKAAGPAGGW